MNRAFRIIALAAACLALVLAGCDSVTRHKVLTTIFDGVPSLPPPEQLCQEYVEEQTMLAAQAADAAAATPAETELVRSSHQPYVEKQCNSCHDKEKEGGLALARAKLCFSCHTDFLTGRYMHGPAAVGDCLSCHEPHSSRFPSLLKSAKAELCGKCHQERRIAAGMHDRLTAQHIACVDCHDPHSGKVPYFLK